MQRKGSMWQIGTKFSSDVPGTTPVNKEEDNISGAETGKYSLQQWQWQKAVAGAVAGAATVVVLQPLDVIRTRFQVHDGRDATMPKYKGTMHAFSSIARTEGWRGLYTGLYPAVLGSTVSWGLYFLFYGAGKEQYLRMTGKEELGPALTLLSAAQAGVLVSLMTNPLWLVKTRLQLQMKAPATPVNGTLQPHYKGLHDAVRSIIREEGVRGLYKGLLPSIALVSHGALQFTAYEEGKKRITALRRTGHGSEQESDSSSHPRRDGVHDSLTMVDFAVLGAGSKLFAMAATYPYQVIRARIQQRPLATGEAKYHGSVHAFRSILKHEGMRGFYKGAIPNALRVMPSSSITFVVYETCLRLLSQ